MNYQPSRIIQQFLIDNDLAVEDQTAAWAVSLNFLPEEKPDDRIIVFDTFPRSQGSMIEGGEAVTNPGLQIRVRSQTAEKAYDRIYEIKKLLETANLETVTIGTTSYVIQSINVSSDPIFLTTEEKNNRRHYVLSFYLTFEEVVS